MATTLDRAEIRKLLPYGDDFLFIDGVLETDCISAIMTVSRYSNDNIFIRDHFVGGPHIVPGNIITEQVCQAAYLLNIISKHTGDAAFMFIGRVKSTFIAPAIAPIDLISRVEIIGSNKGASGFMGEVLSPAGDVVAKIKGVAKSVGVSENQHK